MERYYQTEARGFKCVPLDDDERPVVERLRAGGELLEAAEDGVQDRRRVLLALLADRAGQAVDAEFLAPGVPAFRDPVRVEDEDLAGADVGRADLEGPAGEHPQAEPRRRELADGAVPAEDERPDCGRR